VSLDRLGRSTLHILQTIHDLTEKGVQIKSLKNGEDLTTPNGKLMAAIFSALAEWERELINERAAEGRAARAANGTTKVRPKTALSEANIATVRELHEQGLSPADIVDHKRVRKAKVPMSRATVYRALAIIKEQQPT
jgi:DNA invertase Pin-like site-specific DNA recombinase